MLKSITLENFKAFGQRTSVSLAPITLIYGQNSSGKSSILQSLNLLKQTCESRDANVLLLPRSDSGPTDLGSFRELLFDHDETQSLKIRIDKITQMHKPEAVGLQEAKHKSVGLEWSFSRKSSKDEISLDTLHLCHGDEESPLATYEKSDLPREVNRTIFGPFRFSERSKKAKLRGAKCIDVNASSNYWSLAFEHMRQAREQFISAISKVLETGVMDQARAANMERYAEEQAEIQRNGGSHRTLALRSFANYLKEDFSADSFRHIMANLQIGQFVALEGFIPVGAKFLDTHLNPVLLEVMRTARIQRNGFVDLGVSMVRTGRQLEEALLNLFPLGPFRRPPSRWYVFSGTTPQDVGIDGQSLPDLMFRQEGIREETNEWLRQLDIGYEINARSVGDPGSDLYELRLRDTRRKSSVEVGLPDVGFGISQILPLIVQSVAARNQTITIEQPEVHIHPKLQADLGDLLIESIKKPRMNQFLIETHSEHLALRLQRRIREKQLSPKDVSILYVSRSEDGSNVIRLRLDEEGRFIDGFPVVSSLSAFVS